MNQSPGYLETYPQISMVDMRVPKGSKEIHNTAEKRETAPDQQGAGRHDPPLHLFLVCGFCHLSLALWSYKSTVPMFSIKRTVMYECFMNALYLLTIDAFHTIFKLNSMALRNYHWKFHFNLFVIFCIFLFVPHSDPLVRGICLIGHVCVMVWIYQRTKNTVVFSQGVAKFSGSNDPDYLNTSLGRNWHYILLNVVQTSAAFTNGMSGRKTFVLVPVIGTVGAYLINLYEGRRQTKLSHFLGTVFHAGTSTGMLTKMFVSDEEDPILVSALTLPFELHLPNRLFFDVACVMGYLLFTFAFSYINGEALWKSYLLINTKFRLCTCILLPMVSHACGVYRHHVLVFAGAFGPAMLVLYLNCDIFQISARESKVHTNYKLSLEHDSKKSL
mmetsp:Transcript_26002/g.38482  ORF Transcript_26002/g.38482 Transcript_26002/m.38482 type:complete len:387 (-) Transcript_26002:400-1560(-)